MGANSKIEWTDHTFNIAWGCEKVSPACAHCYAEAWAKRTGFNVWGQGADRRVLSDSYWREPLKWNRDAAKAGVRRKVFCSSMCDVMEDHPIVNAQRERLWPLIQQTPDLDWLLLTKRPENFERFLPWYHGEDADGNPVPPANVWLGVTAENQEWADRRIPLLLHAPALIHFISCEPLLSALKIRWYLQCDDCHGLGFDEDHGVPCPSCFGGYRVDWVIAGGESGPGARPMHPDWPRSLRDHCQETNTAFHFKQWGDWIPAAHPIYTPADPAITNYCEYVLVGKSEAGRVLDGRTWDEVPA